MNNHYNSSKGLHLNYSIISDLIDENSKVLDLGCGNGYLLELLRKIKGEYSIRQIERVTGISRGVIYKS